MRALLLSAALNLTLLSASFAQGVPTVDVTMANNRQGQVEIRVRLDQGFDGVFSTLGFTLRWPASQGVAVDTAVACYPFQDALPVSAQPVQTVGDYMYRTFLGTGVTLLSDAGFAIEPDREYAVCTADLLVPGSTVELINDAWTTANNRDFFSSLGGEEATGTIYHSPEPVVDIHSFNGGVGAVNVMLTPHDDFFGWVTDLGFTLRWPASSGVHLDAVAQAPEVAEYLSIVKTGPETTVDGYTYQRFDGTGHKSIANSEDAWWNSTDITVVSIPISGTTEDIRIVNDAWTGANDGDYRIELNGLGLEGQVEDLSTAIAASTTGSLEATIIPCANGFDISVDVPATPGKTTFTLYNATGQSIWSSIREHASGRTRLIAETGATPSGLYILSLTQGDRTLTKRVVR